MSNKTKIKLLDLKLDKRLGKELMIINIILLISMPIHDGDHIRQASGLLHRNGWVLCSVFWER